MILNPADIVACSDCGAVFNTRKGKCPVCMNDGFDIIISP